MKPELYQEIALKQDCLEFNLQRGDIATLIDYVPSPTGGEEGAILEVFNARGESVAAVTVPVSSIESLQPNDLLSVRRLVTQ
ncbi:DUF4926 domain-containing protein [Oscillatoria sp. HE19RPO]|uniref:DUF4926 domain-containing protein n=1 Tax=Oscillatoria sp. HE19RPO TaxID=2954806 RepID=UPI0020C30A0F|nr:DUF4926 domain-containing protein [Oscillatoria sp. HE19RPO]